MTPDDSDTQTGSDLAALSAAAHGRVVMPRPAGAPVPINQDFDAAEDPARSARIAELKAQYQAGCLPIDEQAIVAKLVDSLFEDSTPGSRSTGISGPSDKIDS